MHVMATAASERLPRRSRSSGGMQPVDISDADLNAMVAYIRSLR
jgi:hypothetical protein